MAISYGTEQPIRVERMTKKPTLSTAYIMEFVRMCFTEDLCEVDFTQSLTAMGFLQALEEKRRNEFSAAMQRLNIDLEALERDRAAFQASNPEIYEWYCNMEFKGKRAESIYTQVYVGLRRWTLINEMRLTPFSKHNCISMLNILYPPTYGERPTSQLTHNTLNAQRNDYFRLIQAVEKSGKDVLINLEQAYRRPGEANGWSVVRDNVDDYLIKTSSYIDECRLVKNAKEFVVINKEKRTDSGVSLSSTVSNFSTPDRKPQVLLRTTPVIRPSTSAGRPVTPLEKPESITPTPTPIERKDSKFERFTRRLKSRSADNRSQSPPQLEKQPSFVIERPATLRKMKSTSVLKDGRHSRDNSSDRSMLPQFTIDDAQRERLIRQAQQDKANTPIKRRPSPNPSPYIYQAKTREAHLAVPEETSPTSCRITRLDQDPYQDPWGLPSLALPSLRV